MESHSDVSDGTNGLTQNGVVKFVPPSDWKDGKTYNVWAFWVRFYITAAEYTTTPQIGHIFMSPPPGIVELYVHDANAEASSELISNVVTAIEAYRAAEVTVNVKAPTKILLAPTCEIKVAKGDKAEVQERVKTMITDYLNAFKMGENFLVNKLETRLLNLDGGTALDTAKITNLTDLLVSPGEIIRPDTANVQVVVIN
jgi:hypothetical protein